MISFLANIFGQTKTPSPFKKIVKQIVRHEHEVETEENIVSTTWGQSKVVKAIHLSTHDSEEWTIEDNRTKLKNIDLDRFDRNVIQKKGLISANYKKVKPYVLAGTYSNKEIALLLSVSKSWVERLSPRIKEAASDRMKKAPI